MTAIELPLSEEKIPDGGLRHLLEKIDNDSKEFHISYTGELVLTNVEANKKASLFLDNNNVSFVSMEGFAVPLSKRLYSGGFIDKEQRDEVSNLSSEEVAEKAIAEYAVKETIVGKIYRENFFSLLSFLFSWKGNVTWMWEPKKQKSYSFIKPFSLEDALANVEKRSGELASIEKNYPQLANVSLYLDRGSNWDKMIAGNNPAEVIALTSRINGTQKISEVAGECGFTKFEMTMFLSQLMGIGAVSISKISKDIPPAVSSHDTPVSWEPSAVPAPIEQSLTPEEKMVAFSAAFAGSSSDEESDWGELGQNAKAGQRKYNNQITKKLSIAIGGVLAAVLVAGGVLIGPALFGEDPRNSVALPNQNDDSSQDNSSAGNGDAATIGGDEDAPKQIGPIIEENAIEDDADIVRVKQTIAIPFDKFSSTLSPEQEQEILAFAAQPLDENETVVISGFAGLNAKEEGNAQRISEDRASSIQSVLSQNDINSSVIGYGNTPADSILGEAMQAAIPEDVTHNRLAFVSAVVVKDAAPNE